MGILAKTRSAARYLALPLILTGAWACYATAEHWLPVLLWLTGHAAVWWLIGRLDRPVTSNRPSTVIRSALAAGGGLLVLLAATQWVIRPELGWQAFRHLNDLPVRAWGQLLALIPPALGCWLFSLQQIQRLQQLRPSRRQRLLLLIGVTTLLALIAFTSLLHISFYYLFLSLLIYLLSLDLYLEDRRTSMTWLLVWLLLMSLFVAAFSYQQSLRIGGGAVASADNYRPIFALTSVFFLAALVYCLLLRGGAWLLGFSYQRWLVPIFGPNSLKIRIQLSFFVLTLLAMGLVSYFTYVFFAEQPQLVTLWLEQLLSVYVFLLLIVGTLGIFFANSISDPIVRISERLGDTRLQNNVPLSWPRDDEIGKLVANYNQMIVALDRSAEQLAATEREGAWREMAKQVAHEIKNPLTPMKLQLQQLLRLEKEDAERARAWSQRISKSIIEQIDGLALIATEFSSFARLPEARATTFDLRELVQSAYALHAAGKAADALRITLPDSPAIVRADRDQLLRVLNNLIRNADQALHDHHAPHITIQLTANTTQHSLTVTDNGPGIPRAVQAKIFQPNFTTKSSGMGLGLAMCKAIVEQAGGIIRFQTKENHGTSFTVNLPSA